MTALTTVEDNITTAHARLLNYRPIDDTDKTALILAALLLHAPSEGGQKNVATDILSAVNDAAVKALAGLYLCGLLAPMRASGGGNPMIGEPPPRSSLEGNVEELSEPIDIAKRNQLVLKQLVLRRDNSRCVLTNTLDAEVMCNLVDEGEDVSEDDHRKSGLTTAAHILPFSLAPNSGKSADIRRSLNVFELIERFSGFNIVDQRELGIDINRIDNVMTLTLGVHALFSALLIWLEVVQGRENVYILKNPKGINTGALIDGATITLATTDPRLTLPNPNYLAIHAACAKIYHASGMSEVINQVLLDQQVVKVLSEDGLGPSFKVLEYSLVLLAYNQ